MKFIHSGDIHLGATPESGREWAKGRAKELWKTFEGLIDEANAKDVDMLIIAGDLFHRQPLKSELKEVNSILARLNKAKAVLVAGNHDCIRKGSYYRDFEWNDNVTFIGSEDISKVSFEEIGTDVYGLSYYKNEITEPKYDEVHIDDTEKINILVAHGGDEKHIPVNRRKLALSGFDYVAFGHIHKPEIDEDNKLAYCGSLEPIDINDTGKRGYIYGEVMKGSLKLEFVPFAKREYKHLAINVTTEVSNADIISQIKTIIEKYGSQNMYKFLLEGYRDPDVEFDIDDIEETGNVVQVADQTEPDYNFEKLQENNKDNIIGMYIEHFKDEPMNTVNKKALYYGTKALLDAMEGR
ncbi:MAG: exonuclease SbcCD subunit D [Eubacterium sp.]